VLLNRVSLINFLSPRGTWTHKV